MKTYSKGGSDKTTSADEFVKLWKQEVSERSQLKVTNADYNKAEIVPKEYNLRPIKTSNFWTRSEDKLLLSLALN